MSWNGGKIKGSEVVVEFEMVAKLGCKKVLSRDSLRREVFKAKESREIVDGVVLVIMKDLGKILRER